MIRAAGIGYIIAAAGGSVLPDPIKWWPFAVVTVAVVMVFAADFAEKATTLRQAKEAADTRDALLYMSQIRKADVDHEWDRLLHAVDADRPLASSTPLPPNLRQIQIPTQRRSSAAS